MKITNLSSDLEDLSETVDEQSFDEFERRYLALRDRFVSSHNVTRENLETGKHLLNFLHAASRGENSTRYLKEISEIAVAKNQFELDRLARTQDRFRSLEMRYCLEKGKCLYEEGSLKDSLDMWEEVLRVDPGNGFIRESVARISQIPEARRSRESRRVIERKARQLIKMYRFERCSVHDLESRFEGKQNRGITDIEQVGTRLWISAGANHVVALNPRDGTFEKVAIRDSQNGLITQLAHCQANGRLYLLFKTHDGKDDLPSTADIEVLDYRKSRYERRPFSKPLGNPRGICVSQKSGNFVVCDLIQRRVAVFSPQDRMVASIGEGQDIELNLRIPSRTAIDRDENLLICDQSLGMIHKIDLAKKRVIWNVRFPGVSVKGIAVDDENNAYFTSQFANKIYKIDNNGNSIYESNIPTEQSNGVFFYDGNIYVYDCLRKEIFEYLI